MKLKTAKEIAQHTQSKRQQVARDKLMARIDEYAEKWIKTRDEYNSVEKRRIKLREQILQFVQENGDGDEILASPSWVVSAKKINGTPYVDGEKLAKALAPAKYNKYRAMVLKEKKQYEANEQKLIQLVQRGIIPSKVLSSVTVQGRDRGYRVEISKVKKGASSNAIV